MNNKDADEMRASEVPTTSHTLMTYGPKTVEQLLAERYNLPVEAVLPEMFDFLKIVRMGAMKYDLNGWLDPNGQKTSESDMHASSFRHLAHSSSYGSRARDYESLEDPLLHVQTRAMMVYVRRKKNIIHDEDK